jgi:sugar (pentulose or hexulose) kinase
MAPTSSTLTGGAQHSRRPPARPSRGSVLDRSTWPGSASPASSTGWFCLDAEDHPVRPAKLWNDTTTEPDCAWLTRKLGGLDAVLALTGNAFLPGYTAPKVSWFHRSEPDAYGQTARICLPHDYLNLWLTGEYVAEPGDASGTGCFDVRARTYQADVLTLLDADRAWERTLPPVGPSISQIGGLRPATAEALGLAPGTPVSAGGVFELPVQRPAVSEAAALGAALQVRQVVDGVGPPAALLDATWEPRPSDALRAARDRTAELRQLAAEHTL